MVLVLITWCCWCCGAECLGEGSPFHRAEEGEVMEGPTSNANLVLTNLSGGPFQLINIRIKESNIVFACQWIEMFPFSSCHFMNQKSLEQERVMK